MQNHSTTLHYITVNNFNLTLLFFTKTSKLAYGKKNYKNIFTVKKNAANSK